MEPERRNNISNSVSVVIPAFNVEAFLDRAIKSVLAQSLPPVEILVVDDGSTDGTAKVAQMHNKLVRYIYQKNAGASAARNCAIQKASGEFIAFLDADDEWLAHHLESAMEIFQRYPFLKWYAAAHEERSLEMRVVKPRIISKIKHLMGGRGYLDNYFGAWALGKVFWTGTFIIRKSVFDQVGLFDTNMQVGEDLDMWFRIALRYPAIGYSTRVGAIYWRRYGGLCLKFQLDLRKSLSYYERFARMAAEYSSIAAERYAPVLRRILLLQYIEAVKTGDYSFISEMGNRYGNIVPFRRQIACFLYRLIPPGFWTMLRKKKDSLHVLIGNFRSTRSINNQ